MGQQETLQPGRYMLRHIAPAGTLGTAGGVVAPAGQGYPVLAQTLYAEPLPISRLPSSSDLEQGKYTLRMLDAGDFELTFPNKDASDGRPWRERFATDGHREFIEISREGDVECIGCIVKQQKDRQKVTLTGYEPFWLLRKAYEQDYTAVIAPRDLIERYSGLNVIAFADEFPGTSLSEKWESATEGSGKLKVNNPGLSLYAGPSGVFSSASATLVTGLPGLGEPWSLRADVTVVSVDELGLLTLAVQEAAGNSARLMVGDGFVFLEIYTEGLLSEKTIIPLPSGLVALGAHTLLLQSDGRWISGYFDGQLVGVLGGYAPVAASVATILATTQPGVELMNVIVTQLVYRNLEPFLMRGSEKGDYVLPGSADTYPFGGLHGRYVANGATTSGEQWWQSILAPNPRTPGFPTYKEDQQEEINNPEPVEVLSEYYAARWFGAVYLDLAANSEIQISLTNLDDGARLWIGKTQWGQQIIDDWNQGAARTKTVNVKASELGAAKGWFPIILEYFQGGGARGIVLNFKPLTAGWTDPGGTAITTSKQVIPKTSLSPLGCVDAGIQGSSFFDLIQETAKNFGYQLTCEPRQLESGEFPGQIVPKARIGRDTDEIIEADDLDKRSGINNYGQTLDAVDSAGSLRAFGSGIADRKGSQVAFEAIAIPDEAAALFDMQAWVSAGDIAFPELLAARAQAELALRLGSWENVEGEPLARDRLADTFPLTGALAAFRWRIGDGVRLRLPDVGISDTTCRQIMQVSRSFSPEGRTGTQIGFRSRPKDPLYAVRSALREVTRPARAFQGQYMPRVSPYIQTGSIAGGANTPTTGVALSSVDRVVGATVHITLNTNSRTTGIIINGEEQTAALGGPWTGPVVIDIQPYVTPESLTQQRLLVALKNTSGGETTYNFQVVLTLLV